MLWIVKSKENDLVRLGQIYYLSDEEKQLILVQN